MTPPAGTESALDGFGIVVVHYRNEGALAETLGRLSAEGLLGLPTVVVNNGGDQAQIETICRRHPEIRWVNLANPGYGVAVNTGVRALPPEVTAVLVLTHEVAVGRHTVGAMAEVVRTCPMTLVGPALVDGRNGSLWSLGGRQGRWTGKPGHRRSLAQAASPGSAAIEAEWLDGAVFAMRRDDFEAVGGLDERFFLYFEDVELGWRMRARHRGRVLALTEVWAEQFPGPSLDQYLATRNLLYLLWLQRRWLAVTLFSVETLLRIVVGALRPGNARRRMVRRAKGFADGLRLIRDERRR